METSANFSNLKSDPSGQVGSASATGPAQPLQRITFRSFHHPGILTGVAEVPALRRQHAASRRSPLSPDGWLVSLLLSLAATCAYGGDTNFLSAPLSSSSLPEAGPSLLRVFGAFALVLGLFLGGVWLLRNGRFAGFGRNRAARLNVLETRSLGARQAIYVVAYGQERFLIGSTPAGINLLSHLAAGADAETDISTPPDGNPSFAQALVHVLRGQKPEAKTSSAK